MEYSTQEAHDKFRAIFKDRHDFQFHPEKRILSHFQKLDSQFYVKDCMIGWLEHPDAHIFSKKECYLAIGLQKPNKAFEKFWRFLTKPRNVGHYLAYDEEVKKWVNLY